MLSNLYMRRFVLGWKKLGHEKRLQACIVNHADDLVICCRSRAEEARARMRDIMTRLKLTVMEYLDGMTLTHSSLGADIVIQSSEISWSSKRVQSGGWAVND